jgi:hypothetical protein
MAAEEAAKGRRKVGGAGEHPRVARERSGGQWAVFSTPLVFGGSYRELI